MAKLTQYFRWCSVLGCVLAGVQGADLGLSGEKGVQDLRGNFIPGSSGADWPYPNGQDLNRLKTQEQRAEENNMLWEHSKIILNRTSRKSLSWSQVNCCQRLVDKPIWPSLERAICISSSLQMHMCGTPNRPCARASIRAMEEAGSTSHAVAQTLSQ